MRESDDDDLASFLSGLRAKYNQLFPTGQPAATDALVQQQQHGASTGLIASISMGGIPHVAGHDIDPAPKHSPGFDLAIEQVRSNMDSLRASMLAATAMPAVGGGGAALHTAQPTAPSPQKQRAQDVLRHGWAQQLVASSRSSPKSPAPATATAAPHFLLPHGAAAPGDADGVSVVSIRAAVGKPPLHADGEKGERQQQQQPWGAEASPSHTGTPPPMRPDSSAAVAHAPSPPQPSPLEQESSSTSSSSSGSLPLLDEDSLFGPFQSADGPSCVPNHGHHTPGPDSLFGQPHALHSAAELPPPPHHTASEPTPIAADASGSTALEADGSRGLFSGSLVATGQGLGPLAPGSWLGGADHVHQPGAQLSIGVSPRRTTGGSDDVELSLPSSPGRVYPGPASVSVSEASPSAGQSSALSPPGTCRSPEEGGHGGEEGEEEEEEDGERREGVDDEADEGAFVEEGAEEEGREREVGRLGRWQDEEEDGEGSRGMEEGTTVAEEGDDRWSGRRDEQQQGPVGNVAWGAGQQFGQNPDHSGFDQRFNQAYEQSSDMGSDQRDGADQQEVGTHAGPAEVAWAPDAEEEPPGSWAGEGQQHQQRGEEELLEGQAGSALSAGSGLRADQGWQQETLDGEPAYHDNDADADTSLNLQLGDGLGFVDDTAAAASPSTSTITAAPAASTSPSPLRSPMRPPSPSQQAPTSPSRSPAFVARLQPSSTAVLSGCGASEGGSDGREVSHTPALASVSASRASVGREGTAGGPGGKAAVAAAAGDWVRLNGMLRDAGFSGLDLHMEDGAASARPDLSAVCATFTAVVDQYTRQSRLVHELLAANEQGQQEEEVLQAQTRRLEGELAQARQAAERARREAEQVASLQLPRAEAQHQQQLTRLRNEVAKLKEAARAADEAGAIKDNEIASLRQCISSLQAGALYSADAETAALRQRVQQLEGALKAKDKEVEKIRAMRDASQADAACEVGRAMERAFAAEDALSRLEQEAQGLRARQAQLEQALRARDKDFASLKDETTAAVAVERDAAAASAERASGAEEAARRLEGEAAGLRAKAAQLEASLKASQKEASKLKADAEATRQAAYEEIWKTEDDIRALHAELAQRNTKVTQLEHAMRSKERELAKAREERETGRAAERERTKVAEEVAVRLEMELTQVRVRGAQLEGSLRARDREIARLGELLQQSKGSEVDVRVKGTKVEEGVRKLESDVTQLRMQRVQLESSLKARDREVDKMGKTIEQLKAELHEANARGVQSAESVKRLEVEAAQGRSKALQLEGAVRVKDRELERLTRVLEASRLAEAEGQARVARVEEAARKLEADLANSRVHAAQLDGALKTKSTHVERLSKLLDTNRVAEYESTADLLKTEETARKLDTDLASLSRRLLQLEAAVRARDKEIDKQQRAAEQARAEAAEAEGRRAAAEEAFRKAEEEAAAMRQRAAAAEAATKSKEREAERLGKVLEASRAAETELGVKLADGEAAAVVAETELAAARQRAAAAEGVVKAKEREVERLGRAVEAAGVAEAEAGRRQGEAEAAARRAEGEAANLRAKLAQAEGTVKAKERLVEKLEKGLEAAKAATHEADVRAAKAGEAAREAEAEAATARQRALLLDGVVKAREKEVERLVRVTEHVRTSELDGADKVYEAEAAARAAEAELATARQLLAQLHGAVKAKEKEVEKLGRAMEAAKGSEAEAAAAQLRAEDAVRAMDAELAAAVKRAGLLEVSLKAREREVEGLQRSLDHLKGAEAQTLVQRDRSDEAARKLDSDLAAARQRVAQLEGTLKARDKELERAKRALVEASSEASSQAGRTDETIKSMEKGVTQMRGRLQQLQASLKGRDAEVARLNKLLEHAKGSTYDATSHLLKREAASRALDVELASMRERVVLLEASLKGRDREAERLGRELEAARVAEAEFAARQAALESASRTVDGHVSELKRRMVQTAAASRARQRELEGATKQLEAAHGEAYEAAAARLQAEEAARQLHGELSAARQTAAVAEQAARLRVKEIEQLQKQVAQYKAAEHEASAQALQTEELASKLEADLGAMRQRLAQVEGGVKSRDGEIARLARQLDRSRSGEADEAAKHGQTEEAFRRLDQDLSALAKRAAQLEGVVRAKEREIERLGKQLEAGRVAEAEVEGRQRRHEDAVRKLETEVAAARQRAAALEGQLKGKEKEVERLAKERDGAEKERVEAAAMRQAAEEAAMQAEREAAAARHRAAQGEAERRARERDAERAGRTADAARAAEREATSARLLAEEAARKLDSDAAALRQRVLALEATLKNRDKEVERLSRQVETFQSAEYEAVAAKLGTEEAARKLHTDLVNTRSRTLQLEASVKVREKEMEKLARVVEELQRELREAALARQEAERKVQGSQEEVTAARAKAATLEGAVKGKEKEAGKAVRERDALRAGEEEARAAVARAEEAARKAEAEAATLRGRALHLEASSRVKDREIERLCRGAESAREAEFASASAQLQAEEAARQLGAELAAGRQRAAQLESALRARERELVAVTKQLEQAKGGEATVVGKALHAEEEARKLDTDVVSLRQRVAQLEGKLRARDKEVERLTGQVEAAGTAAAERAKQAEEETSKLQSEVTTLRQQCLALEGGARAQRSEAARLTRLLEQTRASEYEFSSKALAAEEAVRAVELELARCRQRAAALEATVKARDSEIRGLVREVERAEGGVHEAGAAASKSGVALREVEGEAAGLKARIRELEAEARAREAEVKDAGRRLEAAAAEARERGAMAQRAEEEAKQVEGEAAALRARVSTLEAAVKGREKEVENLSRRLEQEKGATEASVARSTAKAEEAVAKVESLLAQTRARATQLESTLVAKDKEIDGLQRMLDSARLSAGAPAGAGSTVGVAGGGESEEAAVRRLESELLATRSRLVHLEHVARTRELAVEKIKGMLADKVTREERRMARDKAVYAALRQAWVVGKEAGSGEGGRAAAGAVGAAAREMRAVEIVGLYEAQREGLEAELSAAKAEVRLLSDQLRGAQNLIAAKDRQGAWRGPEELATLQGRVMLADRRASELQRELDSARAAATQAVQAAEARVRGAEAQHRAISDEAAALRAELAGRPTVEEARGLQREVGILERRIAELRTGAKGAPGAAGAGGEEELAGMARRGPAAGRERMRRDREVHRLGLRAVEDVARDVLVDVVQDVCAELDVRDATTLPAAVRKLMQIVSAAPKMEAWIGRVCEAVYGPAAPHSAASPTRQRQQQPLLHLLSQLSGPGLGVADGVRQAASRSDPTAVPELLAAAAAALGDAAAMRGVLRAIGEALMQRPGADARAALRSPHDAVAAVRQLVALEAEALTSRSALAAANDAVAAAASASSPPASPSLSSGNDQVLPRLVAHFMKLFECPRVEGVAAAMNKVYMTLMQQRNMLRDLADTLGLPQDVGLATLMASVQAAVAAAAQAEGQGQGQQQPFPRPAAPAPQPAPGSSGGGASASEAEQVLQQVAAVLGARGGGGQQALVVAERLVDRLRRLDEVLPRYQRVASQLYEMLRVHGLEELVPAVQRLVNAVGSGEG